MGPRPHIRLNLALLQGCLCRERPRFRRVRCRRLRLVRRLWCWLPRPWCPLRRKESEPGNKRAAAERREFALCLTWELGVWIPLSMILFDAGCGTGVIGGVIRVSQVGIVLGRFCGRCGSCEVGG